MDRNSYLDDENDFPEGSYDEDYDYGTGLDYVDIERYTRED